MVDTIRLYPPAAERSDRTLTERRHPAGLDKEEFRLQWLQAFQRYLCRSFIDIERIVSAQWR
ncbi:MAG: hypothetical protein JKP98_13080 [Rhodobacteraceae bacterium]|nr:hypothetical protein [Paracoccaceae bacterium]